MTKNLFPQTIPHKTFGTKIFRYKEWNEDIQQNWRAHENFGIYFCVYFDCFYQGQFFERETGHYVMS